MAKEQEKEKEKEKEPSEQYLREIEKRKEQCRREHFAAMQSGAYGAVKVRHFPPCPACGAARTNGHRCNQCRPWPPCSSCGRPRKSKRCYFCTARPGSQVLADRRVYRVHQR
jgi:hypothetical protein